MLGSTLSLVGEYTIEAAIAFLSLQAISVSTSPRELERLLGSTPSLVGEYTIISRAAEPHGRRTVPRFASVRRNPWIYKEDEGCCSERRRPSGEGFAIRGSGAALYACPSEFEYAHAVYEGWRARTDHGDRWLRQAPEVLRAAPARKWRGASRRARAKENRGKAGDGGHAMTEARPETGACRQPASGP